MYRISIHGFKVRPGDGILYVHPQEGMMRLHVVDIWPTYRQGKAQWFELWTAPSFPGRQPGKPMAVVLVRNFAPCLVWPGWGRAMESAHRNFRRELAVLGTKLIEVT